MAVTKIIGNGAVEWPATASYANAIALGHSNSIYVTGGTTAKLLQDAPMACDAPAGLASANITASQAQVTWHVIPGSYQYEIWFKRTAAKNWRDRFVVGTKSKLTLQNSLCGKELRLANPHPVRCGWCRLYVCVFSVAEV